MKRNNSLLVLFLLAVAIPGVFGQSAKLRRAQKYMNDLNYTAAKDLYERILQRRDVAEAKINLAECYRMMGDPAGAELWYGQVVGLDEAQPIHKLYYGMALQRNGKTDQAKPWFQAYVDANPSDARGQNLLRSCSMIPELTQKNAGIYQVRNLPSVNTGNDDFSPYYSTLDSLLIFASDRQNSASVKRQHTWTGSPFNELYASKVSNPSNVLGSESFEEAKRYSKDINSRYHDAAVTFSPDGKEIYYTRNNLVGKRRLGKDGEGVTRLKIYFSQKEENDSWSAPQTLPFDSDEYSVAHPTLSKDGSKLYFTSDMPGGYGGMDLYVSEFEDGKWGPPTNLGNKINTEGHEIFPVLQGDYLFFASDGHAGLGGLDLYKAKWDAEALRLGDPENLGAPMNSHDDDHGLVLNQEGAFGYFSSNRHGGVGGDDIYSFVKIAAPVEVFVFDVTNGKPLRNVTVSHSCVPGATATDQEGIARFEVKLNSCCDYTAALEGYESGTKEGCTAGLTNVPVRVEIPLKPLVQIVLRGEVYDVDTDGPVQGATVTVRSDEDPELTQSVTTDSLGRYQFNLRRGFIYKAKAEKPNYLSFQVDSISTVGILVDTVMEADLGLQSTIADGRSRREVEEDEEFKEGAFDRPPGEGKVPGGRAKDQQPGQGKAKDDQAGQGKSPAPGKSPGFQVVPVERPAGEPIAFLLHIYYDFDRSEIRDEALPELEKLLKMLQDNPNLIIELASHTDARGSHRYNKRLSQRRAESVVDWLMEKGISLDRLVPRGYGETMPVNDCVNSVPCDERKHQLNRRTEFRILGCIGCVDPDKSRISQPNTNPKVDKCKNCPF